ncbi:hypothetical protein [Streptomyces sp. NPDC001380]|uniref:hypothetical protein n=1 Tax=Streptomyces sp. NPDC001380 TaxID=3364566 RepID=UPI003675554A
MDDTNDTNGTGSMSDDRGGDGQQGQEEARARREDRSRPRPPAGLVFDDPLDRQTSDDTDAGWGESAPRASGGRDLEWYLSQKPPHHGG